MTSTTNATLANLKRISCVVVVALVVVALVVVVVVVRQRTSMSIHTSFGHCIVHTFEWFEYPS